MDDNTPETPPEARQETPEGASEETLWELSRLQEGPMTPAPELEVALPEELAAYRAGALDPEGHRRVEKALGADPELRSRLIARAGLSLPAPPRQLRGRVLAAYRRQLGRSDIRLRARRWVPAIALAASLLLAVGLWLARTPSLPASLDYRLSAWGAAELRALPAEASALRARPETLVRLRLEPRGLAEPDISFGLYRRDGEGLRRLDAVRVEAHQGSAELSGLAGNWVGTTPGAYEIFAVAARPGDLPATLALAGENPLAALAGGGRRRAHRVLLTLEADFEVPTGEKNRDVD